MRPSSSSSEPESRPDQRSGRTGLFDGVLARGPVPPAVDDDAWLRAMLETEAALARALARAGRITAEDARAIEGATRNGDFDIASLGQDAASSGNPVVPLVRALTAAVPGPAATFVHHGATSQDILDTAAMLVARGAMLVLEEELARAAEAAAALARTHRDTLIAGRTLLQHAAPTTFGLKAAGWMTALDGAGERLAEVRTRRLAVQYGGAVGTLAVLGADGPVVVRHLADELGLADPVLPWHTDRTRIADIAGALGTTAGTIGKVALDVVLLAQTEVGEVADATPGRGGSSTLPNKRNPIAAIAALAGARRAPGLVASLLAAMPQEHERAAGGWHAEWRPFCDLFETVGSAATWLRDAVEHLDVDAARMRAGLDATGGSLMAERVSTALTPALGREAAQTLVARAAADATSTGRPLLEILSGDPGVIGILAPDQLAGLLDPTGHPGSAGAFVDRSLAAHDALPRSEDGR